jgi:tetraacyldisaccharide 4'-kinase
MRALSRALERGTVAPPRGALARAVGRAWGEVLGRTIVRRIERPAGVQLIAIGGATLGGSGKTPLAIECARSLGALGVRVALVGHAYRASPGRPRIVTGTDHLRVVGDEALLAARELEQASAEAGMAPGVVVVGPTRASAVEFAARCAAVVIVDGVVQTAPVRASLALLAVDATEPWGRAGRVPPWGDLRAPRDALREASDLVVPVGPGARESREGDGAFAEAVTTGAWLGSRHLDWQSLRSARVGLVCALGRPDRIVRLLARNGVVPEVVVAGRDHGPVSAEIVALRGGWRAFRRRPASAPRVDLWLATPKCALHALHEGAACPAGTASAESNGAPLATLAHGLRLSSGLLAALTAAAQGNTFEMSNLRDAAGAFDAPSAEVEASPA